MSGSGAEGLSFVVMSNHRNAYWWCVGAVCPCISIEHVLLTRLRMSEALARAL